MAPLFFKKKDRVIVVYTIGSASVGGAVVLLRNNHVPEVVYTTRHLIPFQENLDIKRLRKDARDALDNVSGELKKNGLPKLKDAGIKKFTPHEIHCTLSSPWFISEIRTATKKEDTPFRITQKIIDELAEEDFEASKESSSIRSELSARKIQIIEKNIVQSILNGYPTSNPKGKKANELSVKTVVSATSETLLESFSDKIQKYFQTDDIFYHSFPLAAFSVLRDFYSDIPDFIFLDITGEITDVSVVRDDVLWRTASFPMGKRTLLRKVAQQLNVSKEEAGTILRLYQEGRGKNKDNAKIISAIIEDWNLYFAKTLKNLADNRSIPAHVFFTADKDMEEWFTFVIGSEEYSQSVYAHKPFDIQPVNTALLHGLHSTWDGVTEDPFLTIATLLAGKSATYNG